ncbi:MULTISPECIES: winged helix-turn-helix domain-containing protein [Enterobacterales]|uniref:winged helix-turn-helix domain-containing protein n=1 Tax=Enterobacterales TaxID=91347 RepID=UPI002ED8047C
MSIIVNNWRMDSSLSALIHCESGEIRRLGEYHFILLEILAKNADIALSRSYLMSEVWKNRLVGGNSLPTAIHALRVAVDDDGKQQEIIKTIPKKGYLFNKRYLTRLDPHREIAENIVDIKNGTSDENKGKSEQCTVAIDESTLFSSALNFPGKINGHRVIMTILPVIIILLFLFFFIDHPKKTPPPATTDTPVLIKEAAEYASHVTIYHLYDKNYSPEHVALVPRKLHPGILKVNTLLVKNNITMTLYYKVSQDKIGLDIVLRNQCDNNWQLVLNLKDWQNKVNEINTFLFQEVENMLTEISKCE